MGYQQVAIGSHGNGEAMQAAAGPAEISTDDHKTAAAAGLIVSEVHVSQLLTAHPLLRRPAAILPRPGQARSLCWPG
jgi:hypothetical protein